MNVELSVIIPTHKRRDYLVYELEQIYKQKNVSFEVIVVNDIEEDDETDIITELFPNLIYIKDNRIIGPSNKHKEGYRISKGDFLYIPDDDDFLVDDLFFRKAINLFYANPDLSFVSGNVIRQYEYVNSTDSRQEKNSCNHTGLIQGCLYLQYFQVQYDKPASTVSTIYRKSSLTDSMIEMSDSSMYMYSLLSGDAFIIEDFVAVYRIKVGSLTSNASKEFLYSVLRQKEDIFERSKGYIKAPRIFWSNQFRITYGLIFNSRKTKKEKLEFLFWGIKHSHGSIPLIIYLTLKFFHVLMSNNNNFGNNLNDVNPSNSFVGQLTFGLKKCFLKLIS